MVVKLMRPVECIQDVRQAIGLSPAAGAIVQTENIFD